MRETIARLVAIYGSRYSSVLRYAREEKRLGGQISPGRSDILAQVKHAVKEESALTVGDFLLRRSFIGLRPEQGLDAVETIAGEMQVLLGWNDSERSKQVASYRAEAAMGRYFREKD
jgi:glycerol-3-phosphate dehydrogenase